MRALARRLTGCPGLATNGYRMGLTLSYLAQGRVWIKPHDGPARLLDSPYATSVFEKGIRSQQRHSWKSEGSGFLSGGMLWGKTGAGTGPQPVLFTSVAAGPAPGQLVYSMASGSLCALCAADNLGSEEHRVWNDNRQRARHFHACPTTGNLACSIQHDNGTANIGVMVHGQPGFSEVTEGDSVDTAPHWIPGEGRRLVYQSAGVGRNAEGHAMALGPFSVERLDIDSGAMDTLMEDPAFDFLSPAIDQNGALFYIRRPHNEHTRARPLRALKDTVLLPFRLLYALFQFLNHFSMWFTGKKLSTPAGTPRRDLELKKMMIWGNMIEAQSQEGDDEAADLVPGSWQLVRRSAYGAEEVLAKGVVAYDIKSEGAVVYSNGNVIFLRHPDGRIERLHKDRMIEQVVVLNT